MWNLLDFNWQCCNFSEQMEFKLEKELSLVEKKKIGKLFVVSHKYWFHSEIFVIS